MVMKNTCFTLLLLAFVACKNADTAENTTTTSVPAPQAPPEPAPMPEAPAADPQQPEVVKDEDLPAPAATKAPAPRVTAQPRATLAPSGQKSIEAAGFTDVIALDGTIKLDVRYATANNFTKAKIYDCQACLLRPESARAVVKAHKALQEQGYGGLKMFDCYRPRPYQQRLWDKVPNPDYVTPPAKGSMHSRGAAVDLTIVDKQGRELDMGTEYDYFGEKGHYDYTNLPAEVLENRRLLRRTMEAVGFQGIRTEWWHFSYRGADFPFSDFVWECK
jgi:zinc D-Ala-D-Ala dipeptidase